MSATRDRATAEEGPTLRGGRGGRGRRAARRVRNVAVGDERRVGLWLLPLFLLTAALAATLSGGLAVLYYAQQVADLRAETAGARAQLQEAVTTVEQAVDEATTTIDEQVARVRAQLAQGVPVDSPGAAGVYAVAARHAGGEVRVGTAFTVFSDDNETFLVTTAGLVTAEGTDQSAESVESVDVFVPGQTVVGRVNGFDRELDLATVVVRGGPLPVTRWRPAAEALEIGDGIYLVGISGPDAPVVAEGRIAAASRDTIVATVPVNSFTSGAPLLDVEGRVVGIAAMGYQPFGPGAGALGYSVPIRALCRALLRCTSTDIGADSLGGAGSVDAPRQPAPGARAVPAPSPTPRASPIPTPSPSPSPSSPSPATPSPSPSPGPSPDATALPSPRPPPPPPAPPQPDATGEPTL